MENASKALIIAGSVLIAILLIGFGMKIFNSTTGTADQVEGTMQTTEMATFNNKFTAYVGTRSLAQVKSLANIVIANNATSSNKVKFNDKETAEEITTVVASLTEGNHTVSIGYTNGLVSSITVS